MDIIFEEHGYQGFPDPSAVLSSEVENKYLLPIGLLPFSHFDKTSGDEILIAYPVDASEGTIGRGKTKFFTDTCRENWVGYKLVDGKWTFDCPDQYFSSTEDSGEYLSQRYFDLIDSFESQKKFFNSHGFMQYKVDAEPNRDKAESFIINDTPACSYYNWFQLIDVPYRKSGETRSKYDYDITIQDQQGRDYTYIGVVHAYSLFNASSASIFYFYEPEEKKVLVTFEYS